VTERIPIALCFDVEPDDVEIELRPQPWVGFEKLFQRVMGLRERVADATGERATFGWYLRMDPQIAESHGSPRWVAEKYRDQLDELRAAGDVIGLHPHAWRWLPDRRRWMSDHGSSEWVEHCARVSFDAFETVFGEPCRFVRWGDRFLSAQAIRLQAELGARFDLTVEPGAPQLRSMHSTPATGRLLSMEYAPREPYRPSEDDPRMPARTPRDDVGLWEVPLTALDPDPVLSRLRWLGRRLRHFGRPLHRPATLVAPMWPAQPFWRGVEDYLEATDRPHLAFAVRSDAPIRPSSIAAFDEKIAMLLELPLAKRLVFTTPDDLVTKAGAGVAAKTAGAASFA
jgi:hypothetical protein